MYARNGLRKSAGTLGKEGEMVYSTVCGMGFFFLNVLPARFDWSIMGCTILLLALMNLAERKKREKEIEGERERKTTLNHRAFTHRRIHHKPPQRQNSFA